MKDRMEILGDIISPAADEDEWEVLRDWSSSSILTSGCGVCGNRTASALGLW